MKSKIVFGLGLCMKNGRDSLFAITYSFDNHSLNSTAPQISPLFPL